MQVGRRYTLRATLSWTKQYIFTFLIYDAVVISSYHFLGFTWMTIPWQPISLIGIAVAFYLGFKNNSAYERLWEARKIWGGIVNTSRAFTVMARDFVSNDEAINSRSEDELNSIRKKLVHTHVAWLRMLALELRKLKTWEHADKASMSAREMMGTTFSEEKYEQIKPYLSEADYEYIMSKENHSSHIMSIQSKKLMSLRREGVIEHFRHLEMQALITEFYALQGKSERIKNFPFPRQYATVNHFFSVIFIMLLPFGMLTVFAALEPHSLIWLAIPFSVVGSWVFWMMEMIGDYSENPFEGLFNDVPITSMAVGIERDIRQMLDEEDLPEAIVAGGPLDVVN
ncbi:MAG: putative membrane protein [Limisphaerales bacterium]|jgi:putative membrane protein